MATTDRTWCGTSKEHVAHPVGVGAGAFRCAGWGRYHDDHLAVVSATEACGTTWTGPTGVVWDCTRGKHPSDPTQGYCGSGHTLVARSRPA